MMRNPGKTPLLCSLTFTLIIISSSQTIQISEITNNAGALILEKGEGRIIAGYNRILHIIELSHFEASIKFVEKIIENAQEVLSHTDSILSDIIESKLNNVKTIYNNLKPKHYRNKRSLDFLGTAIKLVTGNLDANDLQMINLNIEKLKTTGETLIAQNNKQIKINSNFEDRINFVNDQFKSQLSLLKELTEQNRYFMNESERISIIFNLNTLLETLNAIENAIMLAELNIVSRFILTQKELETIAQEMQNNGLHIQSLDDAYSYLSPTVFYRGSSLIICANVPRLTPTHFKKLNIEPLPHNNRTIKLNHKEVLKNEDTIFAIKSKCKEYTDVTLCERKQLIEISDNQCESQLLKGRTGKCLVIEKYPQTEIVTLSRGTILVKAMSENVSINSTCRTHPNSLKGIFQITYHNCSIYVKNELYENYEIEFHHPIIIPLQPHMIQTLHIERHVDLAELHKQHTTNRDHLQTIDLTHKMGFGMISSTVLIMAICLSIFYFKFRPTSTNNKICSGRAKLEEGRVKTEINPQTEHQVNIAHQQPPIGPLSISSPAPELQTQHNRAIVTGMNQQINSATTKPDKINKQTFF